MAAPKYRAVDLWGNSVEEPRRPANELIPLSFGGRTVRMVIIKGDPWWVASDLARALAYRDAANACRILRDRHKGTHRMSTLGGEQEVIIVSEPGLFRLMMRSDHPEAEAFQDWITDEVLPEIRRTGTYDMRGKRAPREAKRLSVNLETAKVRCEQFALNRLTNREMADEGACPNDFRAFHNAIYRGQFGADAPTLKGKLGQKPRQPLLDRMGFLPMLANAHIKGIARERLKSLGPNLPPDVRDRIVEEIARDMTSADLQRLGPTYRIDLTDDPKRGKIIDVVRNELAVG